MKIGKLDENIYAIFIPEISSETLFLPADQLRFDDKWNWIMPVVQKIYDLEGDKDVVIIDELRNALSYASLEGTYNAVINFIQWYSLPIE